MWLLALILMIHFGVPWWVWLIWSVQMLGTILSDD
jgi:hypothetical protein